MGEFKEAPPIYRWNTFVLKDQKELGAVTHTCNPSYSRGGGGEIKSSRPARQS
jgi:hypothetical protein